jgi:hypothetical protein
MLIDSVGNIISPMTTIGENRESRYNNSEIAGYVAIIREPTRVEINEIVKYYKYLKKIKK